MTLSSVCKLQTICRVGNYKLGVMGPTNLAYMPLSSGIQIPEIKYTEFNISVIFGTRRWKPSLCVYCRLYCITTVLLIYMLYSPHVVEI